MKENSYTELMKSSAMNKKKLKENYILDLYIEMFLTEILLKAEKESLLARIDKAIDERNKENFDLLSEQFRELSKRFGT
ncbi:IDEAL domain-containing protein [Niallia endozanthoxylica]|uniref:IDEAL domain-containing protein n=1 Tax=Niallia endozanthoxylica TaxID=2036016 RepID=A0A5J5HY97_9BACI|nr:IDEAL domain-containing protein [Niallia endozanthoxylica]KAA9027503.1 IDEAL domain-containing protein [Niallia endozanthoxylica]